MMQLAKLNNKQKSNRENIPEQIKLCFQAIGTQWEIDIKQQINIQVQALVDKINERIESFDKTYSRFRKDSLITKIASKKGTYIFPPDFEKLFNLYKKLYTLTNREFSPLIGNALTEAGYDADYSLVSKKINKIPTLNILSNKQNTLTVYQPTILDFGAAGKGYLIDLIAETLKSNNINFFCVDAGGDILYRGPKDKQLRIGLENPKNSKEVIGVAQLENESICGSAGNRRKWGNYHHIMSPKTSTSPQNILATWVIAKETIVADGLSTALFLISPKKLSKHFDFEYFILFPDFSFEKSAYFPAEIFIK